MMKKVLLIALVLMLVSGCSTMTPARYAVSADNNQLLKQYAGNKLYIESLTEPTDQDTNCRLMGPIKAGDNLTVTQFIAKAFNDEFKFADLHDVNGKKLVGEVTKIKFSSMSGLTSGWWDLGINLTNEEGKSISVENKYDFKSGFDAITACNQTARALGDAVQDLIKSTINSPEFVELIK